MGARGEGSRGEDAIKNIMLSGRFYNSVQVLCVAVEAVGFWLNFIQSCIRHNANSSGLCLKTGLKQYRAEQSDTEQTTRVRFQFPLTWTSVYRAM